MKMFLADTNLGCGNKAQKGVAKPMLAGGLTSRRSPFLATPTPKAALFLSEADLMVNCAANTAKTVCTIRVDAARVPREVTRCFEPSC
jgi:hypothetical protein